MTQDVLALKTTTTINLVIYITLSLHCILRHQ